MRAFVLAALVASCASVPLLAQSVASGHGAAAEARAPFVRAEAEAVVRELATQLEESFVFPDKGEAYAGMLRSNLQAGRYASFPDAQAFAEAVTNDLQAVHKDGHLRLRAPRPSAGGAPAQRRSIDPTNAIRKSGWIAPGVAYIDFTVFPGDPQTLAKLRRFLSDHKDAGTLIIDARDHGGGGLAEMDMMFPLFYARPTVLVQMDTRLAVDQRSDDPMDGEPTVRKVPGPSEVVRREHFVTPAADRAGLRDAKIYLLTSNDTASAAEHLALSLKRTGRATIVGETTAGAGHYGSVVRLPHEFAAFVPVGRTFDPDTGEGWEGTGVKPNVEVSADKALDEALKLAGVNESAEVALAQLK